MYLSPAVVHSTMPKTRQQIKRAVERKLTSTTCASIMHFLKGKSPKLWGEERPRGFKKTCYYIALYKELYGKSIRQVRSTIKGWWPHQRKTLTHNQQVIQRLMGKWGRKQVQCGTSQEWNRAVQHWDMPKVLKGTNLWMDSVDLQMKGKSVMKKKNRKWSYKLDAPGRWYLFIFDGKGRVKKWWGGYSPQDIWWPCVGMEEEMDEEKIERCSGDCRPTLCMGEKTLQRQGEVPHPNQEAQKGEKRISAKATEQGRKRL